MNIEDIINNQNQFRDRIDLLTIDFSVIAMNFVKNKMGNNFILDNDRKNAIQSNIEYLSNVLDVLKEELNK